LLAHLTAGVALVTAAAGSASLRPRWWTPRRALVAFNADVQLVASTSAKRINSDQPAHRLH
jgi:hypothetical protein